MGVQEIDALRGRLYAVGCVADTLATGWDTFELVEAVAGDYADRAPDTFAAFLFAAASAADGRDTVGFAPSMPASTGILVGFIESDSGEMREVVGELAGLVSVLGPGCRLRRVRPMIMVTVGRTSARPARPAASVTCSPRTGNDGSHLR
jgi:hypothetical protein